MATKIIGVDFSGAKAEGKTWAAQGRLSDGGLWLDEVRPITRPSLYQLVAQLAPPAVVAMDFPFGVPAEFVNYICGDPRPSEMPDVWRKVADMGWERFLDARNGLVEANRKLKLAGHLHNIEPKRAFDVAYHREGQSPLHTGGPSMLQMTYEGICLLHRWHTNYPQRWYVPPLPPLDGAEIQRVTLLEVMPGMLLKVVGLPYKLYKGEAAGRRETRIRITDGLGKFGVNLPNLSSYRADCINNDDCLDAVVAAVGAAMWAQNAKQFRRPTERVELAMARLEGCIFAPA